MTDKPTASEKYQEWRQKLGGKIWLKEECYFEHGARFAQYVESPDKDLVAFYYIEPCRISYGNVVNVFDIISTFKRYDEPNNRGKYKPLLTELEEVMTQRQCIKVRFPPHIYWLRTIFNRGWTSEDVEKKRRNIAEAYELHKWKYAVDNNDFYRS